MLTFEMLDGAPPFQGQDELEVYRKVSKLDLIDFLSPRFLLIFVRSVGLLDLAVLDGLIEQTLR